MGFFIFLGIISKFKRDGRLEDLEAISGSSAGALLGLVYCLTKGDTAKILDFALNVPLKQIMKPNIKCLLKEYGLIPYTKIKKIMTETCQTFMGKDDVTFQELYEFYPVKLYVSAYCVDFMKSVYFSVDSSPTMSVLEAICASVAVPFLFSRVKLKDGWNYIDGGTAEFVPGGPFLGQEALVLRIAWNNFEKVKDLKTYAINILYSTLNLRHTYDFPTIDVGINGEDMFDFSASNDTKLKLFLRGYESAR